MQLEVRDMSGRLVLSSDLGKRDAGQQLVDVDGRNLSAGTYTWTLSSDGQRRTGLLVRN